MPKKFDGDYAMNIDEYPQDISPDEARLGFRLLLVDGIGALMGSRINPVPVPIVACVLSSSDILVKIYNLTGNIRYSHRRWGSYTDGVGMTEWIPVLTPCADLKQFILDYNAGTHQEAFPGKIHSSPFTYRDA
jgi:hypothetical protein